MKILLFGGSFDPPHRGHKELLNAALKSLRPDYAYLIPTHQSPLKTGHRASSRDRLRMIRIFRNGLASAWKKKVKIDLFELQRKHPSYTYQTLRHFRSRYSAADLWFLTGSDSFASLSHWKRPQELQKACGWIVGRRPGTRASSKGLPPNKILPGHFPPISSTEVRCRLLAGLTTKDMLSKEIAAYIQDHGLYGINIYRELERTLSPERFRHTLEVVRLALKLADRHGLDPQIAATAALLHDAGRRFRPDQMARYAITHRLRVPALEAVIRNAPLLLHAYISEDLARKRFHISNPEILSGIRNHTLGAVGMSHSDRLIYVADTASGDRGFSEATRIRALALRNLQAGFISAVKTKINYVKKNKYWLHPGSRGFEAWCRK